MGADGHLHLIKASDVPDGATLDDMDLLGWRLRADGLFGGAPFYFRYWDTEHHDATGFVVELGHEIRNLETSLHIKHGEPIPEPAPYLNEQSTTVIRTVRLRHLRELITHPQYGGQENVDRLLDLDARLDGMAEDMEVWT